MLTSVHELFPMLPPQAIPSLTLVRQQLDSTARTNLEVYATHGNGLSHSQAAALLQPLLPSWRAPPAAASESNHSSLMADDATHDRYFHVHRINGPAGSTFLRSALLAAFMYHTEMARASGERSPEGDLIGNGFTTLLRYVCACEDSIPTAASFQAPAVVPDRDPMRRWVQGHQIFAALTQGIIFALQEFEAAMRTGLAETSARQAITVAAEMLRASGAAFRFTANFSPKAYREIVRPSMMSERLGEGFSGLLSADHRHMVAQFARLRAMMPQIARQLEPELHHLTAALNEVYENHKFVCARFDGSRIPSLRCPNASPLPGVEQLERYQRARLELLQIEGAAREVIIDR
jgi:hypothetical protein